MYEMKVERNTSGDMIHQLKPTSKLDNNIKQPRKHEDLPSPDESSTSKQLQHQPVGSRVHLSLHLKIQSCMELVHTCTKYGYMQLHTEDMHEKGQLFPNNMIMESQVSGLAKNGIRKISELTKFGLEKLFHQSNVHHHTYHIAHNI